MILPFTKQHKGDTAIRNYLDKLTTPTELSGLLNHALAGIQRVLSKGNFTKTDSTADAAEQYRLENNSVARFIDKCIVTDPNSSIHENLCYKYYVSFVENDGLGTAANKTQMRKEFAAAGIDAPRRRIDGDRIYVFEGIRYEKGTPQHDRETDDIADMIPL